MHTPQTPDPANRPSSVSRQPIPAPPSDRPGSKTGIPIPPADGDSTPTVISSQRPNSVLVTGLEGKRLGHFEILGAVGVGGMAAVLRATDLELDRIVALKILPPEMAADPENVIRFKQEARSAAKLDHENIAGVYFCGEDQGLHFIAFEFVEGDDLRAILSRSGPLSPAEGVRYLLQLASGLAHASQRGVVHRDLKPSNILITPAGLAKIVDMGLARATGSAHGGVTQSGVTLGTFDYISPEQALEPREADVRSDIYSLGCTFYHALTGHAPVPEGTAARKLQHHQNIDPTDPREWNPGIPDELAAVLARMMAKDPTQRYQSAEELIQHLLHVAQVLKLPADPGFQNRHSVSPLPEAPRQAPLLIGLIGVTAVLLLAIVIGLSGRPHPPRNGQPIGPVAIDRPGAVTLPAPATPPAPVEPMPPAPNPPKQARTVEELAQLISQTDRIVLTAPQYVISDWKDLVKNQQVGLAATVRKLRIEGEMVPRPVIRLTADPNRPNPAAKYAAALTLTGMDRDSSVEFHNVRFVIDDADSDLPHYAIAAIGLARLETFGCEFVHSGNANGMGGAIRFEGRTIGEPAVAELNQCVFEHGAVALDMVNRGLLKAKQCAFGPHDILARFQDTVVRPADASRPLAELTHCTALMRDGSVFQLERNVSGTLRAGDCLFARATDDPGETVLVRQADPKDDIAFAGPAGAAVWRNAYYRMVLWSDPVQKAEKIADCRAFKFPFKDAGAMELTRAPWKNPPLAKLADTPAEAFALNSASAHLRIGPDATAMLGVQRGNWGETYSNPLPPPTEDAGDMPAGVLVVDPAHVDEAKHQYADLETAVRKAKPGETILIAAKTLDVDPIKLNKAGLTIQAKDGVHPTLQMTDTAEPHAALVTVYSGTVTFKNLHFHLKPGQSVKAKTWAVAALVGSGQCSFEKCTATLEEGNGVPLALAAVALDPDAMPGPAPKIRIRQTFIRGKGDVVSVRGSRPFELEIENTLAVLDGSVVSVQGQAKDAPVSSSTQMKFQRVTAYLNDAFLELRAADSKSSGLTPALVQCDDCLFVAAGVDKPFVHAVGVDGDALTKQLLVGWEAHGNVYGNYAKMLHVELPPSAGGGMTMPADMNAKEWLKFTHETVTPEESFARVTMWRAGSAERPFATVQPGDLRPRFADMKPIECGAKLSELPQIDEE